MADGESGKTDDALHAGGYRIESDMPLTGKRRVSYVKTLDHPWVWYLTHGERCEYLPIIVHPAVMRAWSKHAAAAAGDLHASLTHARKAGHEINDAGGGLAATEAATRVLSEWTPMVAGLRDTVDGFGAKLTDVADLYDRHEAAAADLFAPNRITPVHPGPQGGMVPD